MSIRAAGLTAAGVLSVLALAPPALAAPVTVELRVEGPTRTLFEGPVTTDERRFRFSGDPTEYVCDGRAPAGSATTPQVTRGAAITAAAVEGGLDIRGTFNTEFQSPAFSAIAGESLAFDPATQAFFGEYKNGRPSDTGACGDPIADGDRVLFAYGVFGSPLLALAGAATARRGAAVELTVTDEAGRPVAGATVGGQQTGPDGKAALTVSERGEHAFKAVKTGAIRSNRASVCVTDGQDGFCGTGRPGAPPPAAPGPPAPARDAIAPAARIAGIRDKQRFSRARAPRELRFTAPDASGLASLKLRLTRRAGRRCAYLSGSKDRFVGSRCGRAFPFGLETDATSFLVPERLGRGRYVLDVLATDRAGNRARLERGRTRVVFSVR